MKDGYSFHQQRLWKREVDIPNMGYSMEIRETRRHVGSGYSETLTSDQSLGYTEEDGRKGWKSRLGQIEVS